MSSWVHLEAIAQSTNTGGIRATAGMTQKICLRIDATIALFVFWRRVQERSKSCSRSECRYFVHYSSRLRRVTCQRCTSEYLVYLFGDACAHFRFRSVQLCLSSFVSFSISVPLVVRMPKRDFLVLFFVLTTSHIAVGLCTTGSSLVRIVLRPHVDSSLSAFPKYFPYNVCSLALGS